MTSSEMKAQHRLELQALFETFTADYRKKGDRTKHVYCNPPTGIQLEFPCIVYRESRPVIYSADNKKYLNFPHWTVTTMTRDPEALDLAPQVSELPYCTLDSPPYKSDGIVHHVFSLYW